LAEIGSTLRDARTARGLSIEQVAQDTRISARFLEALESERFDSLPAPVYVRGFLRSYATYLRLDPAPLLEELTDVASQTPPSTGSAERVSSSPDALSSRRSASAQHAPPARSDPFKRSGAVPRRPEPVLAPQYEQGGDFEPGYEPYEPQPEPLGAGAVLRDAGGFAPDPDSYRRRRTQGVLAERPDDGDGTGGSRLLIMAAGGIFVLLSALAAAVFLTQGSGGDDDAPAAAPSSPTAANRTVVPVGSATAVPSGSASASPSAAASPSSGATPDPNATATPTTAPLPTPQPTPSPVPGTAPTQGPANTPTPESTPTPSATPAPPTPTLIPPTPFATATPIIAHPVGFSECAGGDCGPAPLRVVCVPDGSWFVDVGNNWGPLPPGWREVFVNRANEALDAC
jgi:cytoskeleton protein RodZ